MGPDPSEGESEFACAAVDRYCCPQFTAILQHEWASEPSPMQARSGEQIDPLADIHVREEGPEIRASRQRRQIQARAGCQDVDCLNGVQGQNRAGTSVLRPAVGVDGTMNPAPIRDAVGYTASPSRDAVERLLQIDPAAPANPRQLSRWLMLAHPNDVGREDIEHQVAKQELRIASHHKVEGLVFPNWIELTEDGRDQRAPRLDAVADTALFNGIYLAGLVAKYDATSDPAVLAEVGGSVDAVYKLTHVTGMPGLLSRYALPFGRAVHSRVIPAAAEAGSTRSSYRHIYYGDQRNVRAEYSHLENIVAGRDGLAPVRRSPVGRLLTGQAHYGDQYLCTRASRDQLTGIVFGLAFAMKFFEAECGVRCAADRELWISIRRTLSRTAASIYRYLRAHDWKMVDPFTGSGGGVNVVSGLLRTAVELLFRRALMNQWTDPSWRDDSGPSLQEQLDGFRQDTNGSCLAREIQPNLLWMRLTWPLTSRYYAWHLRLLRLVSVLALDDLHPACLANLPPGWPAHSVTQHATTRRNRAWLQVLDKAFWRSKGNCSDPWSTYLFNRIRADVFMRHLEDPVAFRTRHPDLDLYSMSRADFDRIAMVTPMQGRGALRKVLFDSLPAIGCELPRAHFHLRSLAIKPWRSHTAPCGGMDRLDRLRCQTHRPQPVYPPHLMKFTTNFLFEKDPTIAPPAAEDAVGWSERMLIDLPVLYWMIVQDGQWRSQWDSFASSEFTPPGNIPRTIAETASNARHA